MKSVFEFAEILGSPVRHGEDAQLQEIGRSWGVELPGDYCAIAGAYGDVSISGFVFLCGVKSIQEYASGMGRDVGGVY